MCTDIDCASPIACNGDVKAKSATAMPLVNSQIRHSGTGRPSCSSVQTRR